MPAPLIIAHRALSPQVAENSLRAIRRAAELDIDLVELDVRLSLDGRPFLIHDRVIGPGMARAVPVRMLPAAVLRRLRLRHSAGEHIPTLNAALDLLNEYPDGPSPAFHVKEPRAVLATIRAVQAHNLQARTWFWLHGAATIRSVKAAIPEARCTLLEPRHWMNVDWEAHAESARQASAAALSVPYPVLTEEVLRLAHDHHLQVFTVIQAPALALAAVEMGLDGVITDDPVALTLTLDHYRRPDHKL